MTGLAATTMSLEPSARIEFGVGAIARLPECLDELGADRVFLVTDVGLRAAGVVDRVVGLLESSGRAVTVHDAITPNPGTATLDAATAAVRSACSAGTAAGCAVVALGGGSVLDAAKGIALLGTNSATARDLAAGTAMRPGLLVVAVPTTAGTGAETNGFGVIEDERAHRKLYVGDASVRPRVCVLDPELTVGLPRAATAATGIDALVHGIESLASRGANPVSVAYAAEAVRLVSGSLAAAVADGADLEARAQLLLASHLAGRALSISGLGLVHGIAHATTSHTGAVHGVALAAVLTEVMERTAAVAGPAYARVAEAMGASPGAAVAAAGALASEVGVHRRLREVGVVETLVTPIAATARADAVTRNHPRLMDQAEVEDVVAACR